VRLVLARRSSGGAGIKGGVRHDYVRGGAEFEKGACNIRTSMYNETGDLKVPGEPKPAGDGRPTEAEKSRQCRDDPTNLIRVRPAKGGR
jgi:hypothetical protein